MINSTKEFKMSKQKTSVKPQEFYDEYYSGFLDEDDRAYYRDIDTNLSNYPNNLPKGESFIGHWLIYLDSIHYYMIDHDNIEDNKKTLNQCVKIMKLLTPSLSGNDKTVFNEEMEQIPLLFKVLKKGYCISPQLLYLFVLINNELVKILSGEEYCKMQLPCEDSDFEFLTSHLSDPSTISFDSFVLDMDEVIELIKKNERWQKPDRDLNIYYQREKGRILQDIADDFNIVISAVSQVEKKVRGKINFWKGKIFEDFVEKRLKESRVFIKVIKEAGKGESDIRAYTKNNEQFIYSLKNLKIDRKPYWLITKEELLPELKDAKLCSLDYETHLILLVYDNHNKEVKQIEIDYNNVENIDLTTL